MATISQQLSEAIHGMTFEDLPAEVVQEAKARLLDFIAVTVPAWDREEPAKIAAEYAKKYGGPEEATVFTVGTRVSAHMAAFANGVAGHCLELDDDHNTMVGHPGVPVLPAVIAAGERVGANGKQLLLGTTIAYDVVNRTAMAVKAGVLHGKGFHPTGTNGAFGATAGAAKMLGLSEAQIMNAFGICGSQSSGLIQGTDEGVWTKRFNPGWAAHNGVTSSTLAQMGFTGPTEVFEGRHGWYNAYAGAGTFDLNQILDEWGKRFEITLTSWKPYACNRYSHGPIDCAFDIRRQMGGSVNPDEIERIEVLTFAEALPFTAEPYDVKVKPRNTVDSQFSTYYAVAVSLLTGRALLDEFSNDMIRNPEVLGLAAKVTIGVDPELQELYPKLYPASVVVHMKDGRRFEHMVRTPKGDPEWNLTREELEERFRTLASRVFDDARVEQILKTIDNLEDLMDTRELTKLCVRG